MDKVLIIRQDWTKRKPWIGIEPTASSILTPGDLFLSEGPTVGVEGVKRMSGKFPPRGSKEKTLICRQREEIWDRQATDSRKSDGRERPRNEQGSL